MRIKRSFFILVTVILSFSFTCNGNNYSYVNSSQARDIIKNNNDNDDFYIIDARRESHYEKGHIPEAIHIDPHDNNSVEKLSDLDKNATYLIYCRTHNRIFALLRLMHNTGFKNVILMTDGWLVWQRSGFEVEIPSPD